nr:hypothetical protein [Tanacetum cinerariifolium]
SIEVVIVRILAGQLTKLQPSAPGRHLEEVYVTWA